MKKLLLIFILFFYSVLNCFSIEIRIGKIIESIQSNPISCNSVLDLFYDNTNNLLCVFQRQSNRKSVFRIDQKYDIQNILYEDICSRVEGNFNFIKDGKEYPLKYSYNLLVSTEQIDFSKEIICTWFGESACPYYLYVNNKDENIVFNFNTWRLDKRLFYPPEEYFNSLSEIKKYSEAERLKILKLQPAYTEINHHCTVNQNKNRIAIILNDYNGKTEALIIFEVLYDAKCNDTHVRVRNGPDLLSNTLGYLNKDDSIKIIDQSEKKYEIDGESWYWYKVESGSHPDGWVYGKYLDIE